MNVNVSNKLVPNWVLVWCFVLVVLGVLGMTHRVEISFRVCELGDTPCDQRTTQDTLK